MTTEPAAHQESLPERINHLERGGTSPELSQNIWLSMRHEKTTSNSAGSWRGGGGGLEQTNGAMSPDGNFLNFGDSSSMQQLYGQFPRIENALQKDINSQATDINSLEMILAAGDPSGQAGAPKSTGDSPPLPQAAAPSGADTGTIAQTAPGGGDTSTIAQTAPSSGDTGTIAQTAPSSATAGEVATAGAGSNPVPGADTTAASNASGSSSGGDIPSTPAGEITAEGLQPSGQGIVNGVLIGVDGHPEWGGSYSNLTPQQQADAVRAMGLGIYQGDINENDTAQTQALLTATQNDGLQFLANIGASPSTFTSAQQAYSQSFQEGAAEGADFGSQIKLFQLGNEMDGFAESSPQNFQIAESEIQGLTAGLMSTDPGAETIVNSTNAPTGIEFLQQLQADGVNWDITGFHAYTQNGDVVDDGSGTTLAAEAALGKPIYITELNGWSSGSTGPSALPGNAQLMTNSLNNIESVASQDDIIGVNFYELLNQPEISGAEGQFGVLNSDGTPTATSNAITAWMNSGGQTTTA